MFFIAFEDVRYDSNDMLTFVASMELVNDIDYDSDSNDDEFIDEKRPEFFNYLVVEHERLIKSYMKNNDVLEAHKNKIDALNDEKINLLEKVLSIILSLRRIMPSFKGSRIISLLHLWMKIFTLELKCLMKLLTNEKLMVIKEVWGTLIRWNSI